MWEHENHADDVQMSQTDKSWWMMSQRVTQNNCTDQSHKLITQDGMTS